MKQYVVRAHVVHPGNGGKTCLKTEFDTLKEAEAFAATLHTPAPGQYRWDCVEVEDMSKYMQD